MVFGKNLLEIISFHDQSFFFIGSRNGLSVVLNIESYEYMAGPNNEAGVKLYLHNPQELPLVRDLGFVLAPGMHFLVDIDNTVVCTCL